MVDTGGGREQMEAVAMEYILIFFPVWANIPIHDPM